MFKLVALLTTLCLSAPALATQCMIKVTSSSYINAKQVAVVVKWDEDTVVFKGDSDRYLVTVSFSDPRNVDSYIEQILARIELCL